MLDLMSHLMAMVADTELAFRPIGKGINLKTSWLRESSSQGLWKKEKID
jgi:hypothetical protein